MILAKIDQRPSKVEIYSLNIVSLKADILLGVQLGVDVTIEFITTEKAGKLRNVRTMHFTGPHASVWSKEKALAKVIAFINNGGVIITDVKYPEPEIV